MGFKKTWQKKKRITFSKIMEIAFWGTVIWGVLRLFSQIFHFTPYGLGAFARPFLGVVGDFTARGITIGSIVLFLITILATVVYSFTLGRFNIWWGGIVYGAALLLLFGFFFRMRHWYDGTLSTEIAWFLTFGLFIGMSITAETLDKE